MRMSVLLTSSSNCRLRGRDRVGHTVKFSYNNLKNRLESIVKARLLLNPMIVTCKITPIRSFEKIAVTRISLIPISLWVDFTVLGLKKGYTRVGEIVLET